MDILKFYDKIVNTGVVLCFSFIKIEWSAYFIVMIGFMQKHNDNNDRITIFRVMKILMKVILLVIVIWSLIIIGWYIIGLPTGIGTHPTI